MCIRDRAGAGIVADSVPQLEYEECHHKAAAVLRAVGAAAGMRSAHTTAAVSYTHLRAHETVLDLVCRLLLEKTKQTQQHNRS